MPVVNVYPDGDHAMPSLSRISCLPTLSQVVPPTPTPHPFDWVSPILTMGPLTFPEGILTHASTETVPPASPDGMVERVAMACEPSPWTDVPPSESSAVPEGVTPTL